MISKDQLFCLIQFSVAAVFFIRPDGTTAQTAAVMGVIPRDATSSAVGDDAALPPRSDANPSIAANTATNFVNRILRRSEECGRNDTCGRPLSPNATSMVIALGVV